MQIEYCDFCTRACKWRAKYAERMSILVRVAKIPPKADPMSKTAPAASYEPFTLNVAIQLAAPYSWFAAIMPTLLAASAAIACGYAVSAHMALVLMVICILMQCSVNTFNDYFDFVKGTDSAEDNVEEGDAALIYNNVNPACAKWLAIGFLAAAFALGLYVISQAGLVPLGIALVGAGVVVLYSGGKTPISYLPIGELVSGFTMGGLIPLACFYVLTGTLDARMLLWALPTTLGIGLLMMSNNTCDIEKDTVAGRKTLPLLLGRAKAVRVYHGVVFAWIAAIVVLVGVFFIARKALEKKM